MKASFSWNLDGVLQFILSLSLSAKNKLWLGEKLIEVAQKEIEAEESEFISKEEILAGIDAGLREVKLTREGKLKVKTAREFLNEL